MKQKFLTLLLLALLSLSFVVDSSALPKSIVILHLRLLNKHPGEQDDARGEESGVPASGGLFIADREQEEAQSVETVPLA